MKQIEKYDPQIVLDLGAWLGRHQAFGMIANRCSAADAECLKNIRDGGHYKQLELTWEEFCEKYAGVSRLSADRQIHYFEEFGGNYHRFAEVMSISPSTYRLIAGAVTDEGLDHEGERIPLLRENRKKLAAAVSAVRSKLKGRCARTAELSGVRKSLASLDGEVLAASAHKERRVELIRLLEEGSAKLQRLARALHEKTLVLEDRRA